MNALRRSLKRVVLLLESASCLSFVSFTGLLAISFRRVAAIF